MLHGITNAVARTLGILAAVLLLLSGPGGTAMSMDGKMQADGMPCDDCGDAPSAAMAAGACVAPCPGTTLPASLRVVRPSDDGHVMAVAVVDHAGTGRAVVPDPFPPKLPA